jgi:hypothetical protein
MARIFNRSFLRFQFEAELLLQSGEDRRTRYVCRIWIWCPFQLERKIPLEASPIHQGATELVPQVFGQSFHGSFSRSNMTPAKFIPSPSPSWSLVPLFPTTSANSRGAGLLACYVGIRADVFILCCAPLSMPFSTLKWRSRPRIAPKIRFLTEYE